MFTELEFANLIQSQRARVDYLEKHKLDGSKREEIEIDEQRKLLDKLREEFNKVDGGGVRVDKQTAIKILKRQKEHEQYHLPFDLMCFEYGKDNTCDECMEKGLDECICWNGLETDDIETLEEDDENHYENFELRF